jgi:hypothetical protein
MTKSEFRRGLRSSVFVIRHLDLDIHSCLGISCFVLSSPKRTSKERDQDSAPDNNRAAVASCGNLPKATRDGVHRAGSANRVLRRILKLLKDLL